LISIKNIANNFAGALQQFPQYNGITNLIGKELVFPSYFKI
jgi:hypothetical protein